jgi:hypothetical protein
MPSARATSVNATAAALLGLLHAGPMTGGQLVAAAGEQFGVDPLRSPLVLRLLHAGMLTTKQRAHLVGTSREAYAERLVAARAAARGESDPYRKLVADFAVAHVRAMLKLLDAVPEE